MISALSVENILSWAAQVFVIASLGALLPLLFRLRHPRSHLAYCHLVLLACLVLPIVQPWQHPSVFISDGTPAAPATAAAPAAPDSQPAVPAIPWERIVVWVFAAGMAGRLIWFAAGLWEIRRYRAEATLLAPLPESIRAARAMTKTDAQFCISSKAAGPVTFGMYPPVILFPESFVALEADEQTAIACHELLHVQRRDWLTTLAEEAVGVLFWCNPAVWWLLAQTRLAREQQVDAEVVRLTAARDSYIDALLAMAGARPNLDLVPAPLFLRRRHLTQRMHSLLSEVSMSGLRLLSSYALMAGILAAAGWLALVSFPLTGEAQIQVAAITPQDPNGITINTGGAVLRRTSVPYPFDAQQKRIEGAVFVELTVNKNGDVLDARVLSGPDELRKTVLQSVLQWRYAPGSAPTGTVLVSVDFRAPLSVNLPVTAPRPAAPPANSGIRYNLPANLPMPQIFQGANAPEFFQGVLTSIDVSGVDESIRNQVMQRLAPFQGLPMTPALPEQMDQVVRGMLPGEARRAMHYDIAPNRIDKTLKVSTYAAPSRGVPNAGASLNPPFVQSTEAAATVTTTPFGSRVDPASTVTAGAPTRVRVGGNVQAANLIQQVRPEYAALAKQARIQGVVVLEAIIGTDGRVINLQVVSGHPLLITSALDAVKQWVYQPTLLDGQPVEVVTTVTVNFSFQGQ